MINYKTYMILFILFILLCGVLLVPFVQSIDEKDSEPQNHDSKKPSLFQKVGTSIRNNINQLFSAIEHNQIVNKIISFFESSPVWEKISDIVFDPKEDTLLLKQQHAIKIKTTLD